MKISRTIYFSLFFILFLGIIFLAVSNNKPLVKICFRELCIQAEVAASEKVREKGLMFRKSMPQERGMLFVFEEEALFSFWMKNTYFPLDIIWIDRNKKIVDIYEFALPCKDVCKTITPSANAQYVLEVNAGFTKKHGINIGDSLNF